MKIEAVDLMEPRYVKQKLINKFSVTVIQFLIGCIKRCIAGIAFTCSLNINNNVQFLNVRHNLINFVSKV